MPGTDQPAADPAPDAAAPVEAKALDGAAIAKLPLYRCHKEVRALRINKVEPLDAGGARITAEEVGYGPFLVTEAWLERAVPLNAKIGDLVGGFYVAYEDGFASWSPSKAFTEGYTRIG